MRPSIRFGERVRVRKREGHLHPVYKHYSREQEIGAEPVGVLWSGYYRDLFNEGAIEVVEEDR